MENRIGLPAVKIHAVEVHDDHGNHLRTHLQPNGRVAVWKQHYRRNEPLDCAVYALSVCELIPRPTRRRPRLVRV